MRIGLIHALGHSIVPSNAAFARLWPEARLANLPDDRLSADRARQGELDDAMTDRFLTLARLTLARLAQFSLAQFSLARAADGGAKASRKKVLTTPDSAVRKLRRLLGG